MCARSPHTPPQRGSLQGLFRPSSVGFHLTCLPLLELSQARPSPLRLTPLLDPLNTLLSEHSGTQKSKENHDLASVYLMLCQVVVVIIIIIIIF